MKFTGYLGHLPALKVSILSFCLNCSCIRGTGFIDAVSLSGSEEAIPLKRNYVSRGLRKKIRTLIDD